MSDAFDAYNQWLGIPPHEQPPNHYRLLGLELFEDRSTLIEEAVVKQTELVKTYQLSQYSAQCQDLLDEIATASVCLLDCDKRAAYEERLRLELQAESASTAPTEEVSDTTAGGSDSIDRTALPQIRNLVDVIQARLRGGRAARSDVVLAELVPEREIPGPRRFRFSPLAVPRLVDRLLAKLAGEGNEIVHHFLRVLSVSALTLLIGILAYASFRLPKPATFARQPAPPPSAVAALPERSEQEPEPQPEREPEAARLSEDLTNDIGMQFKLIPAGEFMMGSLKSDETAHSREMPQHRVRITRPFYLGVYEVTQQQYENVMGENPSHFRGPSLPVEMVSWEDAAAFCAKLSAMDGRVHRLPTEAEWEYACRAGTTTRYSCGDKLDPQFAWFRVNSGRKTHPVGEKRPNPWGLYDMHGNVCEWCGDWYDPAYYASAPLADPTGPARSPVHVFRGGGWAGYPAMCRSAVRFFVSRPKLDKTGFRVALIP